MNCFPLLSAFLLLTLHCNTSLAQSPAQAPAQGPAPPGPTNISAILDKAGQFTIFLRLLKSTQVGDHINTQLNNSNQGMTIFAPPDNAFSNLKSGTLNSLTDQDKVELLQFHVIPTFVSLSEFQTVSNPLSTQAGNANGDPLNVTTTGNAVNITTGVTDTSVSSTIYTDGQLAVYQVDKVLLPLDLFGPPAPASAPKPEKGSPPSSSDSPSDSASADSSSAVRPKFNLLVMSVIALVGACSLWSLVGCCGAMEIGSLGPLF